jgi:hypothetical protein
VHSRRPESRDAFAARLARDLGKPVKATQDWRDCVEGADIIVEASRLTEPAPMLKTAWIKMNQWLQGWQRIHNALFLGAWKSAHTLRIRFAIDYQTVMSAPFDLDVDSTMSGSDYGEGDYGDGDYGGSFPNEGTVYQQSIHLNRRCESILFEISDVDPTDTFGAAFELSELLLVGGIIRSSFKLPATRAH